VPTVGSLLAHATSTSVTDRPTVRRTTIICLPRGVPTAMALLLINALRPWTRCGTLSTSSVPSVAGYLEKRTSTRRMASLTAKRITLLCLPPSVVGVPSLSWRTTSLPCTDSGTLSALSALTVDKPSGLAASLTMKACPTVRLTTMPRRDHYVPPVRSPSQVAASQPCSRSSTLSTSCVPSASSSSTRAPSRSRMISRTATRASSSCLDNWGMIP